MPLDDNDIIDLDAEEAPARSFPFRFSGQLWMVKDPLMLTDDEKEELQPLNQDIEAARWYMGDEQYEKFLSVGGGSSTLFRALQARMAEHQRPARRRRSRSKCPHCGGDL